MQLRVSSQARPAVFVFFVSSFEEGLGNLYLDLTHRQNTEPPLAFTSVSFQNKSADMLTSEKTGLKPEEWLS